MPDRMHAGRLWLARHGRTAWNAARRRLGRADVPLDDVGRTQALALCGALAGVRIDLVYTSPLCRARDTAAPIARERGLAIAVDAALLEFDYGLYEGSLRAIAVRLDRDFIHEPVPGGESLTAAWARAQRFVAGVAPALDGGAHLLVVGHRHINRLIAGVLERRTLEETLASSRYRPAHGSVVEIRIGDGPGIVERRLLMEGASKRTPP